MKGKEKNLSGKNEAPDFQGKIHRVIKHTIVGKITIHGGAYQLTIPKNVMEYYGLDSTWTLKVQLLEAKLTHEEAF